MRVSEWLKDKVDGHDIVGVDILTELPDVTYDKVSDRLVAKAGKSIELGAKTIASMRERQGALETGNPKGAYFPDDVDESVVVVGGYTLSYKLDVLLTGEDGGGRYFGRGSAHRARIDHLASAGF